MLAVFSSLVPNRKCDDHDAHPNDRDAKNPNARTRDYLETKTRHFRENSAVFQSERDNPLCETDASDK